MAREPGDGTIMAEIGGRLMHTEQAQAAVYKGLAGQEENAENVMGLI